MANVDSKTAAFLSSLKQMQSLWMSFFLLVGLLPSLAFAQFGFFDQMFQGGHPRHQQQQQQRPGGSQWAAQADLGKSLHSKQQTTDSLNEFLVPCNKYLCPSTLICVEAPVDCPCPYPEDIKCVVPDLGRDGKTTGGGGTVVCVSGKEGCNAVNKMW
ncbi:hypothetical protein PIIN_09706 [Serendipita indica DSM 11827]|uniref:Long chronological lifespan protein 2 n=1 Tax=Serendipita indica (strain DSM 11827) TaxID=1109443 RepID=G4TWM3_SERID|nr:hypothetical protein PIIN_09706 [Serendipita indica DSM 11827]